jgi:hypothetical protein
VPEIEMANKELKRYKSPSTDPIASEFIKAGGRLISIWNEDEMTEQWKKSSLYLLTTMATKQTSNYQGIPLLSKHTNTIG